MSNFMRPIFVLFVACAAGCQQAVTPTDDPRVRVEPVSLLPVEGVRSPEMTPTVVVDDAEWRLTHAVRVVGQPGAEARVLVEFQVKNQGSSQRQRLLLPSLVTTDGSAVSPLPEDDATAPVTSTLESMTLAPNAIERQWLAFPLADGVRFAAVRFPALAPGLSFIDAPWLCVPCNVAPHPSFHARNRVR